jgi:UDP-N-acetylglucosamine 2-epimerase
MADPRTRIYSLLGIQFDIPTLEIQLGLCGPEGVEWQFFNAKQVAVWGEMSREALLAHGVPADRITLTGSPRHDTMANLSPGEAARIRAQLGVPEGQAMVLFASTYSISAYDEMTSPAFLEAIKKTIIQAAQQVSGLTLVIKPHPLEDVRHLRQLVQGCHNILLVQKNLDIRQLIKASDAFIGLGSSITLEALITGQLTICPFFSGWVWTDPFGESGATLVPRSAEEVLNCFQMVVNGSRERVLAELEPARRRFLEQWVYKIDGQASTRIAALAEAMALRGTPDMIRSETPPPVQVGGRESRRAER